MMMPVQLLYLCTLYCLRSFCLETYSKLLPLLPPSLKCIRRSHSHCSIFIQCSECCSKAESRTLFKCIHWYRHLHSARINVMSGGQTLSTWIFSFSVWGPTRIGRRVLCVVMRQSEPVPEGTSRSTYFHLVGPLLWRGREIDGWNPHECWFEFFKLSSLKRHFIRLHPGLLVGLQSDEDVFKLNHLFISLITFTRCPGGVLGFSCVCVTYCLPDSKLIAFLSRLVTLPLRFVGKFTGYCLQSSFFFLWACCCWSLDVILSEGVESASQMWESSTGRETNTVDREGTAEPQNLVKFTRTCFWHIVLHHQPFHEQSITLVSLKPLVRLDKEPFIDVLK